MSSPAAPIRDHLLLAVRQFVDRARVIPGVRRIALIGSLATAKPDPKDADVLVWFDDDADLAPLADAGRKLKGTTQQRNHGADVFIASAADGRYVGRTCRYRDCQPGIRMSCRTPTCGRREYLCDDLQNLTLGANVLASPPVDLWPSPTCHTRVPADVEALVDAFRTEAARLG
ncbi:MAG: hypothetical protein NTW19_22055 [Planctomycetota bacterium]|nr:hypothetical protein [Planctomycetota bacterium]